MCMVFDTCNVLFLDSPIDCRAPSTLANGVTVVQPHNTTVSSVIIYQCQPSGFTPSSNSSVCEEDGRWSPDPSQVACMMVPGTLMEITQNIILLPILSLFSASQYSLIN